MPDCQRRYLQSSELQNQLQNLSFLSQVCLTIAKCIEEITMNTFQPVPVDPVLLAPNFWVDTSVALALAVALADSGNPMAVVRPQRLATLVPHFRL